MKVIYLHQYFNIPKKTGGVRSYDIAKHLINKGHTVEMVTTNTSLSNSSGWETSTEDGINVHWFHRFSNIYMDFHKCRGNWEGHSPLPHDQIYRLPPLPPTSKPAGI